MVKTNNKAKPKTPVEPEIIEDATQFQSEDFDFEIDQELLQAGYNQVRRPILPYGIVVNEQVAGILIPEDQLEKANWFVMPNEDEMTTIGLTEDVTGLLLCKCRFCLLAFVPEYIRYKNDVPDLGGTIIGLYEDYKAQLDKKTMDVASEHAIVFLDENNRPMHSTPIVVRFKNVALWSFKAARDEFYRLLEKTFADYFQIPFSGKNDKWRSLGILEVEFKGIKEGKGSNKNYCCKTINYTKPTIENLPYLYLGRPQQKNTLWGLHDSIAGFTEAPALPAAAEPQIQVLPPISRKSENGKKSNNGRKPPRKIQAEVVEVDDFEDDLDEEEFDDDFDDDIDEDE
ncbi:DUF5895 domain-containing protein [Floridanema aerugineum]|uniref:DUF5895 domain-containing protein n=1 Tax=Floridaenema aerugineum BLCC-F46 TaxID=3153654 RepID=A0ABV4XCM5_9CYAN